MINWENTYTIHIERAIQVKPKHEGLLRSILLEDNFVKEIGMYITMKAKQTENDKEYHNIIISHKISSKILSHEIPRFACFEVGATYSLDSFRRYWISKNYNDYQDYVTGILETEGKCFYLNKIQTRESIPEDKSDIFLSRFLFGHILVSLSEMALYMSIVWLAADEEKTLIIMPQELL